jgi:PleD family two-component response regulator
MHRALSLPGLLKPSTAQNAHEHVRNTMAKPVSPTRLLLVCDVEASRTQLRRRFTRVGYEVMEVADGAKALSLIGMIPFDLAVIDVEGPEADGFEILRRMRESRSRSELPILMVTDRAGGEDAVEALELGANDGIGRPIDIELIYARAEMQVRRRRQEDPNRALETNLVKLQEAVVRAENTAASLSHLGHEVRAPLAGVLRAAGVLTRICVTPELKSVVEMVEASANTLETLLVQAMEHGDRRNRLPREVVRVLSADDDAESRSAIRGMLDAAETPIDLVEVATGLQAALAAESSMFDLILVNISTPESIAGIRAIRRVERQTKTRRSPILAIAPDGQAAAQALDAGADLAMCRPVTATALLAALAGAISRESADLSAVA